MSHRFRLLTIVVAAGLALVACGGDDADEAAPAATEEPTGQETTTAAGTDVGDCPSEDPGADAEVLEVEASDEFAYVPATLEAAAGEIHVDFSNPGLTQHSFVIEGTDVGMLAEAGGGCSETITLDPGTYTVFCDVVGHREAGMETTLTVS